VRLQQQTCRTTICSAHHHRGLAHCAAAPAVAVAAHPATDTYCNTAEPTAYCAAAMCVVLPQAEVGGTVVKVCVENGQSVTPGQPLFIIKP
jgi:multidrug resistance efflux pump